MWERVGDRTELQHIDPHSIGHNRVSFPFSLAAQPGAWGPGDPASLGHVPLSSIFSPTHQISKLTDFLSSPRLYNNMTFTLLVGVRNRTHSTRPRSRLYFDIPRPDAPVIYTGAFPILTARPGRGSIYNISKLLFAVKPLMCNEWIYWLRQGQWKTLNRIWFTQKNEQNSDSWWLPAPSCFVLFYPCFFYACSGTVFSWWDIATEVYEQVN